MKNVNRFAMVLIAVLVFCLPPVGAEYDVRESLRPSDIVAVRVNLNPWGPGLGFETEIAGEYRFGSILADQAATSRGEGLVAFESVYLQLNIDGERDI